MDKNCGLTQHSDETVVLIIQVQMLLRRMHIGHMRSLSSGIAWTESIVLWDFVSLQIITLEIGDTVWKVDCSVE